jgi:DNA-directed RNA polymerase subunit RPC12/RpoP
MGLQCSLLGHAFEDAGVEREREEQGSEVITTEREIERCRRCGTERVVSESTEVAAVVDASDVGLDAEQAPDSDGTEREADGSDAGADAGGGIASAFERSGAADASGTETDPDEGGRDATPPGVAESDGFGTDGPTESSTALDPDAAGTAGQGDPPDPAEEDAEILTDDGDEEDRPERKPGQWPEETGAGADDEAGPPGTPDEESLSGITVPEGAIACPDCSFRIEADSGYRAGDPCPECGAWLEAERNQ